MSVKKIKKLLFILSKKKLLKALFNGCAIGYEHYNFFKYIEYENINHIIDIGANNGQFSLMARLFNCDARIDAFEPLPPPRKIYKKIFKNDQNTFLHSYAIGDTTKNNINMNVSKRIDSSSILNISKLQSDTFPNTEKSINCKVDVVTLESFLQKNNIKIKNKSLLKIDVQGYEYNCLIGINKYLNSFKYIYCEASAYPFYTGQKLAGDVVDYLSSKGFTLIKIFNPVVSKENDVLQADFLFKKK